MTLNALRIFSSVFSNKILLIFRLGMNPFQKNPKHASVLAERWALSILKVLPYWLRRIKIKKAVV